MGYPTSSRLRSGMRRRSAPKAFQVWNLIVQGKQSGSVTCEKVYRQDLRYTGFPLAEITFYCTDNVMLLPGEY